MEENIPNINIIDHKVTLLAAAGAAMTADCRPCLNEVMPELEGAGVSEADLQWAMQNGQFSGVQADLGAFALDRLFEAARAQERDCVVERRGKGSVKSHEPNGKEQDNVNE